MKTIDNKISNYFAITKANKYQLFFNNIFVFCIYINFKNLTLIQIKLASTKFINTCQFTHTKKKKLHKYKFKNTAKLNIGKKTFYCN